MYSGKIAVPPGGGGFRNHLFAQQNHIPITGQKEREIQTYLNSK
jgi:hypothetical protein